MMSRLTGKALSPEDHLRQSVEDILTTPKGSRVMLRDYGSRVFELLGRPIDKMDLVVAVHEALDRWEPRIRLKAVRLRGEAQDRERLGDGAVTVEIEGEIRASQAPFNWPVRLR